MKRVLIPILMLVVCALIVGSYGYLAPAISENVNTPAPAITSSPELTVNPSPTATQSQPSANIAAIPAVGEQAPDFTLPSVSGDMVTLSRYQGQKNIVLVFYRTGG